MIWCSNLYNLHIKNFCVQNYQNNTPIWFLFNKLGGKKSISQPKV